MESGVDGLSETGNGQGSNGAPKPSRLDLWRAQRKLERARAALDANRTAWAWFAAHEAAELAARSIHRNGNGRERMVARLLLHAADHVPVPEELVRKAALLDGHYIPHQNGHALTPPPRRDHRANGHTAATGTNGESPAHAKGIAAPGDAKATALGDASPTIPGNASPAALGDAKATAFGDAKATAFGGANPAASHGADGGQASADSPAVTFGNPNAPSSTIAVQTAEEILAFAKSTFRKLTR